MKRIRPIRIMIFAIAAITAAMIGACVCYATVGEDGAISAINEDGEIVYIYNAYYEDETGTVDGLTYNEASNTLTMEAYNSGSITISDMDDLNIELVGDNTINRIPLADEYLQGDMAWYYEDTSITASTTVVRRSR